MDLDDKPGLFFDKDGNEISIREYSELRAKSWEDESYFRVGSDHVGDYWISTVWIGTNMWPYKPPLIFESMVFKHHPDEEDKDYALEEYSNRYCTLKQAQEGHANIVGMIRALIEVGKEVQ